LFPGDKGFYALKTISDRPPSAPPEVNWARLDCISCDFRPQREILDYDEKIMEQIAYQPQTEYFPVFRRYKPGYSGVAPTNEEVELFTRAGEQFLEAYSLISSHAIRPDYESAKLLTRYFDEKLKSYVTKLKRARDFFVEYPIVNVADEQIAKLQKRPRINSNLELDIIYIDDYKEHHDMAKPFRYSARIFLVDEDRAVLEKTQDCESGGKEISEACELLEDYIETKGIPKAIYCRRAELEGICRSLAANLNIKVAWDSENTPALDHILSRRPRLLRP
jgi:hypothetical protein